MSNASLGNWGVELEHIDSNVRPGDDFFRFVNGVWLDSFELPPDHGRYGSFNRLTDQAEEQIKQILEESSVKTTERTEIEQKIGDYYASFMDLGTINAKGLEPLSEWVAQIDEIDSYESLLKVFGTVARQQTTVPITLSVSVDRKNPDRYLLSVSVSGLGMPDRDYYLEDTREMSNYRETYSENITSVLNRMAHAHAAEVSQQVLDLECNIAKHHWTRAERRDREKTYNVMSWLDFQSEYPDLDWNILTEALGIENVKELNVVYPSAMDPVIQVIRETPLEVWKAYLSYHLVVANAFYLPDEIYLTVFDFYSKTLNGVLEPLPRWRRGVELVGQRLGLGFLVGQLYVKKHFPPDSKVRMDELVGHIRATFKERLNQLPWMGETTRTQALEKLAGFKPKIGYPAVIPDLSEIEITASDVAKNVRVVRQFWHQQNMSRLNQTTDRDEWLMTPQTVNAYYNASFNEIVFPAAILQAPFFDAYADSAVNFGGIGAVIAHEMGHGFDDQGSKFNAKGVLKDWWTSEDRARFNERTKSLVDQYSQYEPVPGACLDGEFTLGENIGDLGGVGIAYAAYKRSLQGEEAPVIDGLTGDQRFFLSYAQIWRSAIREEELLKRIKSDPHSPAEFRVNGIVRNIDGWYDAFDVSEEADLYLSPEERVAIW